MSNNSLNRFHLTPDLFIDTPVTYDGTMYSPVTHRQVIETVEGYLSSKGIPIIKQHYLTNKQGTKAIGVLSIDTIDNDMNYQIAWRNSLDGTMSFQVVSGSIVNVCSNSNIWGDVSVKRKHFGDKTTEEIISSLRFSIDSYQEIVDLHLHNKEILLNTPTTLTASAELIGRLFIEEKLLTANQIGIIKRELEIPTFDYKAPNTLYELHNHCTYAMKEAHPSNWMQQHNRVGNYFVDYALDNRSPIVNVPFQFSEPDLVTTDFESNDDYYSSIGSDDLVGHFVLTD